MSTNLQNYNPRQSTNDWNLWVSLVKKAHKAKGIHLTQAQSLMIAKDSYPGKGNVLASTTPDDIQTIPQEQVPANPPRRKKIPPPSRPPRLDTRERSPRRRSPRRRDRYDERYDNRRQDRYDDRRQDRYEDRRDDRMDKRPTAPTKQGAKRQPYREIDADRYDQRDRYEDRYENRYEDKYEDRYEE